MYHCMFMNSMYFIFEITNFSDFFKLCLFIMFYYQVIKELQEIAGINDGNPEDEAEELNALLEEANMPLQEIVANIKVCFPIFLG